MSNTTVRAQIVGPKSFAIHKLHRRPCVSGLPDNQDRDNGNDARLLVALAGVRGMLLGILIVCTD